MKTWQCIVCGYIYDEQGRPGARHRGRHLLAGHPGVLRDEEVDGAVNRILTALRSELGVERRQT